MDHPDPEGERPDPRLVLVFEEAKRSITQQQAVLDEIRSRTGTLLAGASVATAFLGSVALKGAHHRSGRTLSLVACAVVSFVALNLLVLWILRPSKGWKFRFGATILLEGYVDDKDPATIDEMHRRLAELSEANHQSNEAKLNLLQNLFQVASGLLLAEILLWLGALIAEGGL
jgi:hypothetical protein